MKLASESEDETSSDCSEPDSSHADQGHSSASHPTSNASVSHGCPVDLTSHPSTHDKLCGDIGGGYCNHLVYSQQEQGLQRRSPEASYLRDHVQALQNNGLGVSNVQLGDENVTPPSRSAIQRSLCQQIFQTQQQFFSDLDACHPSSEPLPSGRQTPFAGNRDYALAQMEPVMRSLRISSESASYTPTCAIDAAIMLIQKGHLHVPQLRDVNVKQARG